MLTACERCGSGEGRLERHHPDYSKAKEVEVLCTTCHAVTRCIPSPLDGLGADFVAHRRDYVGVSKNRIRRYERVLAEFQAFIAKPLTEVEGSDLTAYLQSLISAGSNPNTVRQYGNFIRAFYRWAWEHKFITAEVLMQLRSVRNPMGGTGKTTPKPYSRTELTTFWQEFNLSLPVAPQKHVEGVLAGKFKWRRRMALHCMRVQIQAVVVLALDCGLRRGEIYGTSLDDLHYDNEYVVVRGKGGKFREVPYSVDAREDVREWIELRTRIAPEHDFPWLSLSNHGIPRGKLAETPFSTMLHRVGPTIWHLHRFRHTCATERLRAGMPLEAVQRLLGHATLAQTLCYAEIARPDLGRHMERSQGRFAAAVRPRAQT